MATQLYVCTKCKETFDMIENPPKVLPMSGLQVCSKCFPDIRNSLIKAARKILPSAWFGV